MSQRLVLVDGTNILMRSIHAAYTSHMSNKDGVPTGALVIFVNLLSKLVRDEKPDRMAMCWDGGKSEYRLAIYSGYKATRINTFDSFHEIKESSWDLAKRFLTLCNIHQVVRSGVEADDLIAYYWRFSHPYENVVIFSGDKDMLQMVDGWTEVVAPGDPERWTLSRVRNVYKALPSDLPKVMALMGDATDSVPGAVGVGPKKAVALLERYGWDLEALLAGDDKIRFIADDIRRNLALVDLRNEGPVLDLPGPSGFEPTDPTGPLWPELDAFLDLYQLRSIKDRIRAGLLWSPPNVPARGLTQAP